jgi:hypothetical protein
MISLQEIRHLHIEFSSLCNARCPLCPRNLFGYPYNRGYTETSLTLELVQKSFSPEFIQQLSDGILLNGNFGDFTANLESLPILEYFKSCNPNLKIRISTNGSARNIDFWRELGKFNNTVIEFCLDGLEDTHHLYRQDTNFNKILQNAKTYMDAGGVAIWKMIEFQHNKHQIEDCKTMSKKLGFLNFNLENHGRDTGPVFDRDGNLVHIMGNHDGHTDIREIIAWQQDPNNTYRYPMYNPDKKLSCITKNQNSIYIAADGRVYPCCFMGFSPHTYKTGYHGFLNSQIAPLVSNNDLHTTDLKTAISWFSKIESSWTKTSTAEGRVTQCDVACSN